MKADDASQYVRFARPDPKVFQLLRVSLILTDNPKQPVIWSPAPMEVAQLVPTAYVMKSRDEILSAIQSDSFDPRRSVLLESEPAIKPAGSFSPGTVQIINQTTDRIELIADASANSILLVTNAYSKGWRADAIGPSPQDHYDVLPADWAMQAIPLLAGKHHLRLEFRPAAFVLGKWISILSLLGYIAAIVWYFRARGDAAENRSDG
jgi:hypothetical protein